MSIQFANVSDVMAKALEILEPPPDLTVAEWADRSRKLSPEASAAPGQWRTDVVEYMREPMNCVGDPQVRRLSIMAAAQVAKTELLLNIIGYCVDHEPSPMMIVQPTLDMAQTFSKDRLATMLRDTPCLRGKVRDARARDSNNTIMQKHFPGGHITMVGANSPSSLASRPIRVVLCDEVDRFPPSAGSEGDPIQLATKRAATFWNRILAFVSTPTNMGSSRIEKEYEDGDQRQYWMPCPHCDEHQVFRWAGVKWGEDGPDGAYYECEHNGCVISDIERVVAMRKGHWRAQKEFSGNASFHITGLMSPFVSLSDAVREFLAAKGNPELLRVWVNTYLGETWEDEGERLDHSDLMDQREEYGSTIPDDVTILTAGVDVQDDRIEVEVVGWGDDYESWSIDYKKFYGDPSVDGAIWDELRSYLKQVWYHPSFGEIAIRGTCIDTGYHTRRAYSFSTSMDRLFAIKGVSGEDRPTVGRPSRNNIGKVQLFSLGVHSLKNVVFSRLRVRTPGPGYCHFPEIETYGDVYFRGLTSEKLVTRFHKGFKRTEYVKMGGARNEPLDLRVYATAALEIIAVDLNAQRRFLMRTRSRDTAVTEVDVGSSDDDDGRVPKRPSGRPRKKWATGWQQ